MIVKTFQGLFNVKASVKAEAPGRVNLIGEHTDYNGGFVLPTAIPQRTRIQLRPRADLRVRCASVQETGPILEYELGREKRQGLWFDYVQGVTVALAQSGNRIRGFDLRIDSSVPVGSGLSSSAALEVALLRALREAFRLGIDDVTIAKLGQAAENRFVGARVGIMDQMAASLANSGEALFLDTRDLHYQRIPLPASKLELAVVNSGIAHGNATGEYNVRRAECEEASRILGVPELRDLAPENLPALEHRAPPLAPVLLKRVRHVVTENQRVLEAVQALRDGDLEKLGKLCDASHASLRDEYQVSIPEIDLLVTLLRKQQGVLGARLTGGGFGGSVVAVCQPGTAQAAAEAAIAEYTAKDPALPRPRVLLPISPPSKETTEAPEPSKSKTAKRKTRRPPEQGL